jgi:exopolyphosphatase/guanosine-5'-triphosphate,3'-diphosphate pyrophosphatase
MQAQGARSERALPASGRNGPDGPAYAALDLGTNNCRLLVAIPSDGGFRVVDAFSRIVRLGEGLGRSGRLSDPAMDRTIEALRICAGKMRRRGVVRARAVATEACRRAANCDEFLDRVKGETGIRIEIITSTEEAGLSLAGCAPLLDASLPRAIAFDIGGGSTELSWVAVGALGFRVLGLVSLPFGVVTLGEHYAGDRMSPDDYRRMVAEVQERLVEFDAEHAIAAEIAEGRVQMLGSSGTVTTIAGVYLDLPRYDRNRVDGIVLDFPAIAEVTLALLDLDLAGRCRVPCIGRDRADLVLAGCAILEAICRQWPVGRVRVADRGVREGILFSLMANAADGGSGGRARA